MIMLRAAVGMSSAYAALLCTHVGTAADPASALAGESVGIQLAAPEDSAARDDAAVLQCASEQGWRELIEALQRVAPPRTDAEQSAFDRARLRIDATDPRRSSNARAESWAALDAAHAARIAGATDAPTQRSAVVERATDALRIGLFAEPSTASALASGQPHDVARAIALLRSIEEATGPGDGTGGTGETGRTLAFLNAASQALQLGIDRADRGGAASRERREPVRLLPLRIALVIALPFVLGFLVSTLVPQVSDAPVTAVFDVPSTRLGAIVIAAFAPFAEELFFRAFVQGALEGKLGKTPSALISAGIFVLFHLPQTGLEPAAWAPIATLGLGASWLRASTGTSRAGIVAHAVHNAWRTLG